MDKELKRMQFSGYLKSALRSVNPRITLQEIADNIGMSPQYINQITTGKLLPPEETFDLIINILQPRLDEDIVFRIINLYSNAKYGSRSVARVQGTENISTIEAHVLKLFSQLTPSQQIKAIEIFDQFIENNRNQMAENAGLAEEPGEYRISDRKAKPNLTKPK